MANPTDLAGVQAELASRGIVATWTYLGQPVDPRSVRRRTVDGRTIFQVLIHDQESGIDAWLGVVPGELVRTIREA